MSSNTNPAAEETAMPAPSSPTPQTSNPTVPTNEMSEVTASPVAANVASQHVQATESGTRTASTSESFRLPPGPVRTDTTTALAQALAAPATPPPSTAINATSPRARSKSTAIGPPTDSPDPISNDEDKSGPRLELTLLLTSGARHPFILDEKYLAKRNVEVQSSDPYNLSVYKLKELILREWREEWEQKPSSPSYIRLISFGKLLDDKAALKDLKFNHHERNVVHMTIKPQDFVDEDDGKGAKAGLSPGRNGSESRSPGCRCNVM